MHPGANVSSPCPEPEHSLDSGGVLEDYMARIAGIVLAEVEHIHKTKPV